MSSSKMPPVPPASRSPKEAPESAAHAPREEAAHARASGAADHENIRQNINNKGQQQDR